MSDVFSKTHETSARTPAPPVRPRAAERGRALPAARPAHARRAPGEPPRPRAAAADELRGRMAEAGQRIAFLLRRDQAAPAGAVLCGAAVTLAELEGAGDGRAAADEEQHAPGDQRAAAGLLRARERERAEARASECERELEAARRALEAQRSALEALSAREREAQRRAEAAGRARDELAAVVARDVGPALRGLATRAKRAKAETDAPAVAKALGAIGRQARALAELIEALPEGAAAPRSPRAGG